MIELGQKWTNYLETQPETGQGYHDTDVTLRDGRIFDETIVYNGKYADIYENDVEPQIVDIKVFGRGERPLRAR